MPAVRKKSVKKSKDKFALALLAKHQEERKKLDALLNKWEWESANAKSKKEVKKIKDKYNPKLMRYADITDSLYDKYYNHCHKNYTKESIDKAVNKTHNFMSKKALSMFEKKKVKANGKAKARKK